MERGEEEAHTGRCIAFPITNFDDVKARRLPTSGRRKFPSGNFRSARDFEGAERVNPRNARLPTQACPRLLEIEECPHYAWIRNAYSSRMPMNTARPT